MTRPAHVHGRVRVRTGSRLHFGLLVPGADAARRFGGVGLMVDGPGMDLSVEAGPGDAAPTASGPLGERAFEFARRFVESLDPPARRRLGALRLRVERGAPEHAGLGTGTQLGMATAAALAELAGLANTPMELARRVGRGARSSVGLHGFAEGGLLVEGGKRTGSDISPLIARHAFPQDWRVVLIVPRAIRGLHGRAELRAFGQLPASTLRTTDALCRIVLLQMLPAVVEHDLAGFCESLYELQRRVGECFAPAQGGLYSGALAAEIVAWLRGEGFSGVGQSSWGPTLYAVVEDEAAGKRAVDRIRNRFDLTGQEVFAVSGLNRGADVTRER